MARQDIEEIDEAEPARRDEEAQVAETEKDESDCRHQSRNL
jgi:hypothetical protein